MPTATTTTLALFAHYRPVVLAERDGVIVDAGNLKIQGYC